MHSFYYSYTEPYIRCGQCGALNDKVERPYSHNVDCHRCGNRLYFCVRNWYQRCSAYIISAMVCFAMSYILPFIYLDAGGLQVEAKILTGVMQMINRDEWLLVGIVFLSIFVFALFEIIALSFILICLSIQYKGVWLKRLIKVIAHLRPWNMLEIFLVSTVVTSIKLADLASVSPGIGLFTFFLLIVMLILAHREIDYVWLWDWIDERNTFNHQYSKDAEQLPDISCHHCHAFISSKLAANIKKCPRCRSSIHHRIHQSTQKTLALLIAAALFYIPANVLPILHSTRFGELKSDTILSGALYMFSSGAWFVGLVIVLASVVVPVAKLTIMGYLLWAVKGKVNLTRQKQMQLYRITEFIGRWSMIDVFVVISLVAMVQFGILANIEAGSAILPFAIVVIFTMLAAETFDSRLLWDNMNNQQE